MNLSLHPDLQKFVEDQVRAGHYDSAEDLINSAVARLQTEEELSRQDLQELRAEIAIGIDEADHGEVGEWDPENLRRRVQDHFQPKKAK